MPSFGSIPLHPSITARLGQGGPHSCHSNDVATLSSNRNQLTAATASVLSPRSLLIRDLHELVELVSGGQIRDARQREELVKQMESIRYQTASHMCLQMQTARRILHQQHQPNQLPRSRSGIDGGLIPGLSNNGLQLWRAEKHRIEANDQVFVLSSGCTTLDQLLAFPEEYQNRSVLNDRAQTQQVNADIDMDFNAFSSIPHVSNGSERGHILQLSGTSGKTQLSLQFAAQACVAGKRVRYCYSTAGHAGTAMAHRVKNLIKHATRRANNTKTTHKSGGYRGNTKDKLQRLEFLPIATTSQVYQALATLENDLSTTIEGTSISLLVLDAFPSMLVDWEDGEPMRYVERWLKRMTRHYNVWVVVTGVTVASLLDAPDIHLTLQAESRGSTGVRLLRHPARLVSDLDVLSLVRTDKLGFTTHGEKNGTD